MLWNTYNVLYSFADNSYLKIAKDPVDFNKQTNKSIILRNT